jgi:hypothetical protein
MAVAQRDVRGMAVVSARLEALKVNGIYEISRPQRPRQSQRTISAPNAAKTECMSGEGSSPRMTLMWKPMNAPAMPTSAAVISLRAVEPRRASQLRA